MVLRPSLLQMLLLMILEEFHLRKGPAEATRGVLRRRRWGTGAKEEEEEEEEEEEVRGLHL
jgi:hypothetical protein